MNKLWIRNGKFVSDEYGRPLVCPICPCVTCEEKIAWLQHLATVYGGTFYGEGYIRTPDIEELVAPVVEVFQAAMIYAVTVNEVTTRYIITVGCGDDCPLGKRVLRDRESYIEKDGVCDCPALASFIENAEFGGHTVYGESILVSLNTQGGPIGSFGWYNVRALTCYLNMSTNTWHYITCTCSVATINDATYSLVRVDYPCSQCLDMRSIVLGNPSLFGVVGSQQGSYACYETDGIRYIAAGDTSGSWGQTVGVIDYRVNISLSSIGGNKFIHVFGLPDWKIGAKRYSVPADTTLSGVAELFPTGWDPAWRAKKSYRMYGKHICAYIVNSAYQEYPHVTTVSSEAAAIAWSQQDLPIEEHFVWVTEDAGVMNSMEYAQSNLTPSLSTLTYTAGDYTYSEVTRKYTARKGTYEGPTYVLRYIETNVGFLMQDGTYRTSITIPTITDASFGAKQRSAYIETTKFGTTLTAALAVTDPICPDPEEFE